MTPLLDARVRLSNGARLRFDPFTDSFVLLSPERGLRLNTSASLVLGRCTGALTVQEIAREIFESCQLGQGESEVTIEQVTLDVALLLTDLMQRGLVAVEHHA